MNDLEEFFKMMEMGTKKWDSKKESIGPGLYVGTINTKEIMKETYQKEFLKDYVVNVNNLTRKITIAVVVNQNGEVKVGYSVLHPEDNEKNNISENIALGRAKNEKSNLLKKSDKFYKLSNGFIHNYILQAIADNVIRDIKRGKIEIKGIRDKK